MCRAAPAGRRAYQLDRDRDRNRNRNRNRDLDAAPLRSQGRAACKLHGNGRRAARTLDSAPAVAGQGGV